MLREVDVLEIPVLVINVTGSRSSNPPEVQPEWPSAVGKKYLLKAQA